MQDLSSVLYYNAYIGLDTNMRLAHHVPPLALAHADLFMSVVITRSSGN